MLPPAGCSNAARIRTRASDGKTRLSAGRIGEEQGGSTGAVCAGSTSPPTPLSLTQYQAGESGSNMANWKSCPSGLDGARTLGKKSLIKRAMPGSIFNGDWLERQRLPDAAGRQQCRSLRRRREFPRPPTTSHPPQREPAAPCKLEPLNQPPLSVKHPRPLPVHALPLTFELGSTEANSACR